MAQGDRDTISPMSKYIRLCETKKIARSLGADEFGGTD